MRGEFLIFVSIHVTQKRTVCCFLESELLNCPRMRINHCNRVFFMQIFCVTVLHFSSRIIFDFSSDFFMHFFFIFEWFQLLSLRNKVCCSNKTECWRVDDKALTAEWLIPPSRSRNVTQEVGV